MKKEIEDRTHLHKNLEQLYEGRLKNIQSQLDSAVIKNTEYGKMLKLMRKKGAADKDALVKVCINGSFVLNTVSSSVFIIVLSICITSVFFVFFKCHR